jgi:aspartate racemase
MKTLGLIGGTTWHSTVDYYRLINEAVPARLGRSHSAKIILYSLDFQELVDLNESDHPEKAAELVLDAAVKVAKAGADYLMLCANTLHQYVPLILGKVNLPIIHIAEATAVKIKEKGLKKVGLLGTKITMEKDFYKDILLKHGIESLIPEAQEREFIQNAIYKEFSLGIFTDTAKNRLLFIMNKLKEAGAEGMILGCTELPLIIKKEDFDQPLFDTLDIHIQAGIETIMGR